MRWDYVSELLPLTDILFIPRMIHECGERRWNDIDRRKPKNSEKNLFAVPLCPPQIPHGLTRARTRDFAVRGRRLTAWAMTWPEVLYFMEFFLSSVKTLNQMVTAPCQGLQVCWIVENGVKSQCSCKKVFPHGAVFSCQLRATEHGRPPIYVCHIQLDCACSLLNKVSPSFSSFLFAPSSTISIDVGQTPHKIFDTLRIEPRTWRMFLCKVPFHVWRRCFLRSLLVGLALHPF
jgi:hypothetical protein